MKKKNLLILNASPRAKGNISQMVDTIKAEDIMQLPDKTVPEDGANPYICHKSTSVVFTFSVKYTLNGKRNAHHFILEYLKMESFHGQTVELGTNAIVDKFTSLTFPNVAYRIDF